MLRSTLTRSVWLPLVAAGVMLLAALSLMVLYAGRNYDRQQPLAELHSVESRLQSIADEVAALDEAPSAAAMARWRQELRTVGSEESSRPARYSPMLMELEAQLTELASGSVDLSAFAATLDQFAQEIAGDQREAAADLNRNALREVEIATFTLLVVPAAALVLLLLFRKRILQPLRTVTELLEALAHRRFTPASEHKLDPTIAPLVRNYNYLIARLEELEKEHNDRRLTLESQVATAARALLEQQRSLANAEKLAAIGEIAAGIAHELRNPLAGVQMAIANLSSELDDPDKVERLKLVDDELKRMATLLDGLLRDAAHRPEEPRVVDVAETIRSLIALVRYQLPDEVQLELVCDGPLNRSLPEQRLRQAMLNLILNSAQALGGVAGKVTVRLARDREALRIEVHDTGKGFPTSMLNGNVRPFVSHRADGTGLGLAMVQRFARDSGGRLQLSNDTPHGGCVTILLPAA